MVKIHDYFKRRYVPNNMAIVLAGDVDPDATMALVEKIFWWIQKTGDLESKNASRKADHFSSNCRRGRCRC